MSDATPSPQDDLAFLRGLVDEDPRPGLWGFGAIYLAIGIVLILHMAIAAGVEAMALDPPAPLLAYVVLYSLFGLATFFISARSRRLFGSSAKSFGADPLKGSSVKSRAGMAALGGAFIAHLVLLVAFIIVSVRQQDSFALELIPMTLFALQGSMWLVVHAMRRQAWLQLEAWGWFVAVLALAALVDTAAYLAVIGVAAFVLMIVPGVYMMRAARKA